MADLQDIIDNYQPPTLTVDVPINDGLEVELQPLPASEYKTLVNAHPDPGGQLRWNEDTFAPALIAACAVEPEISGEQAVSLWDKWPSFAVYGLFSKAVQVNETPPDEWD